LVSGQEVERSRVLLEISLSLQPDWKSRLSTTTSWTAPTRPPCWYHPSSSRSATADQSTETHQVHTSWFVCCARRYSDSSDNSRRKACKTRVQAQLDATASKQRATCPGRWVVCTNNRLLISLKVVSVLRKCEQGNIDDWSHNASLSELTSRRYCSL